MISGTVAVADTPGHARRVLLPEVWAMAHSRTHGTFPALAPAEEIERRAMTAKERDLYESGPAGHIVGTEEQVAHELETVLKETGAQEIPVMEGARGCQGSLLVTGTGRGRRCNSGAGVVRPAATVLPMPAVLCVTLEESAGVSLLNARGCLAGPG